MPKPSDIARMLDHSMLQPWLTEDDLRRGCAVAVKYHTAAVCARLLGDRNLEDMAREQIYWVLGKNPFAQSMVYGEGFDYPLMDSFSSGPLTGEVPVGIRTIDDTDIPYWPQVNNACYKEVWTSVAGKILSLISEL